MTSKGAASFSSYWWGFLCSNNTEKNSWFPLRRKRSIFRRRRQPLILFSKISEVWLACIDVWLFFDWNLLKLSNLLYYLTKEDLSTFETPPYFADQNEMIFLANLYSRYPRLISSNGKKNMRYSIKRRMISMIFADWTPQWIGTAMNKWEKRHRCWIKIPTMIIIICTQEKRENPRE